MGAEAGRWGYPNSGGAMVTEGGVVFIASTSDATLRAFDGQAGDELWTHRLPANAQSTPMGYRRGGIDYVVVTAGGNLAEGRGRGDYVIGFRLDAEGPPP